MSTAIKIRCTDCHSQSEVTDEALGGQAKCPFCSAVFDVAANEVTEPPIDPKEKHPLELGKLEPAIAFRLALEIFKANAPILFVTHVIYLGLSVGVSSLGGVAEEAGLGWLGPLVPFLGFPFMIWLNIGLTKVTLDIARGIPTGVETLFSGVNCLMRVLVFNLLFGLVVLIGCIAFIVPGVFLMLRFWSGPYFIIDRNCSVSEAFQMASTFSEGNKVTSLQLACLSFGMGVLGLSFFGVGFVLVYPVINLMWTIAYMMMTRQPVQRAA